MIRRPPPPEERCPRTKCIRKRAVVDGKLYPTCAAHLGKGRSRYGVKRVKDSTGREYQSKAEREGMAEFRLREKAGEITELREQVTFWLYIDRDEASGIDGLAGVRCDALGKKASGTRIEGYRADVVWAERGDYRYHVGDFKSGLITPEFQRKARWMAACGWPVEVLKR